MIISVVFSASSSFLFLSLSLYLYLETQFVILFFNISEYVCRSIDKFLRIEIIYKEK